MTDVGVHALQRLEELEHHEGRAVRQRAEVRDLHDVRMADRGKRLRLALKSGLRVGSFLDRLA